VRLTRHSLRISPGLIVRALSVAVVLGVGPACGGGAAAPTPTPVPAVATVAAVPAASPVRPPLASPVVPLPSSVVVAAPTPVPPTVEAAGPGTTYEVQSGDTLLSIARDQYGDTTQWRRIYDANKDTIGNDPDKLKLGQTLKIPPKQ
jgi:nucleoid-associated protein YgaU